MDKPSKKPDESPSETRKDSSTKQLISEVGSRAAKLRTVDAQLTRLGAELRGLDGKFGECEMLIVDVLRSREVLINAMHTLIRTLEKTMIYRRCTENARGKLDERRDVVSLGPRNPNLGVKREQELRKDIENLADLQEDVEKMERAVETSHDESVRLESQSNLLKIANEYKHQRLCEVLVKIEQFRRETFVERCQLREMRRAIEDEDSDDV